MNKAWRRNFGLWLKTNLFKNNFTAGQQYYVSVRFKNMAGQDVFVKPSDHNPAQGWKVKKNFMVDITKGTMSAQPITLVAFADDSKHSPLALNGSLETTLTPHTTKSDKQVLIIGKQSENLTFEASYIFHQFPVCRHWGRRVWSYY